MKCFLRSLTLTVSLLGSGLALPTMAQTPLLEVDYNGATIFHVLNDGRLLLPAGAQDGYVLTATDDGFASWQAASANGGVVASNGTLSGDGTPGNPLGVTVPLHLSGGTGSAGTVYGEHSQGHRGLLGSDLFGVLGLHSDGNIGTLGDSDYGVYGFSSTVAGVYGEHNSGHWGRLGSSSAGVFGASASNNFGHIGSSDYGVFGAHANGNHGGFGTVAVGAYGKDDDGNSGFLGTGSTGVQGQSSNGHLGWLGYSTNGAGGRHDNGNVGQLGTSDAGVYGMGSPYAGNFAGNVHVTGTLSKAGGSFKIDHPLDPAGKYLSHSFVESPDMMNVYNGNVTTDENGEAAVTLPDYFEALNRDFRYQLTVIGQFAQAIVAEKIQGNQFVIRTDLPNVEVSWQVTGIRQDAWAEEHRIVVEEDKPAKERGSYLHPTLFNQPPERSLMWAQYPEAMRVSREMPGQIEAEERQMEAEQALIEKERARLRARQD